MAAQVYAQVDVFQVDVHLVDGTKWTWCLLGVHQMDVVSTGRALYKRPKIREILGNVKSYVAYFFTGHMI